MYILDQSNPFEAQTMAFSHRENQIVQEYNQLFEYFLAMADKCSIINLNEQLLENQSLHIIRRTLLNGKIHFHFQLGEAERQFIRTLMQHNIQCTFEKNQSIIALFDEHILFFKKRHLLVSSSRLRKYQLRMNSLKKSQRILFYNLHRLLNYCKFLLHSYSMKRFH